MIPEMFEMAVPFTPLGFGSSCLSRIQSESGDVGVWYDPLSDLEVLTTLRIFFAILWEESIHVRRIS